MARIRTIKPEFFRHEQLFEAEKASRLPLRLAFAGLFVVADREGRFRWQPRVLKLDVLPFDDVDFGKVLDALAKHGFIVKYEIEGEAYAHIPNWYKHQHVNQRESASVIPAPDDSGARTCMHVQESGEGEREREGKVDGACAPSLTASSQPEEPPPIPALDPEAWARWQDYRKQIRKPIKPVSIPAAQRELAGFGCDQAAVVEQSIANSYQGLFALKTRRSAATEPAQNGTRWI